MYFRKLFRMNFLQIFKFGLEIFFFAVFSLRPIYTVRFLLKIVACNFHSARCSRHGKIVYDFHDIKLPVATIVVGF